VRAVWGTAKTTKMHTSDRIHRGPRIIRISLIVSLTPTSRG